MSAPSPEAERLLTVAAELRALVERAGADRADVVVGVDGRVSLRLQRHGCCVAYGEADADADPTLRRAPDLEALATEATREAARVDHELGWGTR